ncbi:MAG: DinB family protein [Bacillota bacterium]
MLDAIRTLYAYDEDVRKKLFEAVAALPEEEYRRNLGTGHRAVSGTLWHMAGAEDYWIGRVLTGKGPMLPDVERVPLPAELQKLWAGLVARTRQYIASLAEADLARDIEWHWSSGQTVHFTVGQALLHLTTHEIHHRGQIMAMIRLLGHEPPEVDLI